MEDTQYLLSKDDRRSLQGLLDVVRRRPVNPSARGGAGYEDYTTPQVYFARTPAGGIAAMPNIFVLGDDVPGQADCDIYRIVEKGAAPVFELVSGFPRRVYNIMNRDVAGNALVLIALDKFGRWIVTDGPLPASQGLTINLVTKVCVKDSVYLHNGTSSGTALADLTVEYTPVTFPASVSAGTRGCVSPNRGCCGVPVPCCDGSKKASRTLYCTITNPDSFNPCIEGMVIPIIYDDDKGLWYGSGWSPAGTGNTSKRIVLSGFGFSVPENGQNCTFGGLAWVDNGSLDIYTDPGNANSASGPYDCDPFFAPTVGEFLANYITPPPFSAVACHDSTGFTSITHFFLSITG